MSHIQYGYKPGQKDQVIAEIKDAIDKGRMEPFSIMVNNRTNRICLTVLADDEVGLPDIIDALGELLCFCFDTIAGEVGEIG